MELKDYFIIISETTRVDNKGNTFFVFSLRNRQKEEFLAFDRTKESADNHIYPSSSTEIVCAKLTTQEISDDIHFEIVNIIPISQLKKRPELSELDFLSEASHKMPPKVNSLEDGKVAGVFLLALKEERVGQRSKYFELTLINKATRIIAKDFNQKSASLPVNCVVNCVLTKSEKYGYSLEAISESTEYTPANFIRHPPIEESQMFDEILRTLTNLASKKENSIAQIAIDIYEANQQKLLCWSAAKEMHHNFCGGLLYHTYRMIQLAKGILTTYDSANAELLLTAVAIHDTGKLIELDTNSMGEAKYSVSGTLLGHSMIGIEMVSSFAAKRDYNPEDVILLKHCLASHHGEYEYGAIAKPAVLEAFLLHIIDLTDSRVYMFENEYAKLTPGEKTDKKVFGIDTAVYRPNYTKGDIFNSDYSDDE